VANDAQAATKVYRFLELKRSNPSAIGGCLATTLCFLGTDAGYLKKYLYCLNTIFRCLNQKRSYLNRLL
jgi:hypothetical protein